MYLRNFEHFQKQKIEGHVIFFSEIKKFQQLITSFFFEGHVNFF